MVCTICVKRLEKIHRFAMMACKTQDKLLAMQLYSGSDERDDQEIGESTNEDDDVIKKEDNPLLHSILTKVNNIYT